MRNSFEFAKIQPSRFPFWIFDILLEVGGNSTHIVAQFREDVFKVSIETMFCVGWRMAAADDDHNVCVSVTAADHVFGSLGFCC